MSDLQELYQEVILDHNRRPRNFHKMDDPTASAEGHNPLCGDRLTVYLRVKDGIVEEISFEGSGCAISTASASLMTEILKGKTLAEARDLFERLREVATADPGDPVDVRKLGKLAVFAGVREFPMRVKCATLAWHTMHAALEQKGEMVSTE